MVTLHETGLLDRVETITTNPWAPETDLGRQNPVGKVPTLILEGGEALFDSLVICEYLDSLHDGTKLFPIGGGARWRALRQHAMGDGILDAALVVRAERFMRPDDKRWDEWVARHQAAINRALDVLDQEADELPPEITIGHITIGCALGYLDFRKPIEDWRASRPALADWYDVMASRPSMEATEPKEK